MSTVHQRTLTSMLSPIPSEPSPSHAGASIERAQSVPGSNGTGTTNLRQPVISESLRSTHPNLVRSVSDPVPEPLTRTELKAFDPIGTLSPPPANTNILSPPSDQPHQPDSNIVTPHVQPTIGISTLLDSSPPSGATSTTTFPHTEISVGKDQQISSVNSYSSAALSSGSFTAISVSPIPNDSIYHSSNAAGRALSVNPNTQTAPITSSSSASSSSTLDGVSRLSITTPPVTSPDLYMSPLDSTSSKRSVRFDATEPPLTRVVSDTPSMVRVHEEDASPYPDSVAVAGVLSPSFPASAHSPHCDSPLPPVVSALMAAQKVVGTTPGATLSLPNSSQSARLIFLSGDASGAGKSCIAMGLLHLLLKRGYEPKDLAYIKPCTQCEDVQIISKYCEGHGIAHQGLGPVIFYEGFTAEVIDGKTESVDKRRGRITKAVNKIAEGKKWVLVDGVGYAAVGSVAGVSNAEVASLLNAPVLVVGRPGIGNAIDSMNFICAYFEKYHVHTLGACWNKIPPMHSYHSYDACKQYVNKYFREVRGGVISTYGHIPLVQMKAPEDGASSSTVSPTGATISCRLRPAKTDLIMTPEEDRFVMEFLTTMEREFDIELLLSDLSKYYQAHRVQLVSVV